MRKIYTMSNQPPKPETFNDDPETGAVQEFGYECNINTIMEKVKKRKPVIISDQIAQYGDFSGITDFHQANNRMIEIENEFMKVPARVRAKFGHDPEKFISFLMNEQNRAEAIELGLINKPETVAEPPISTVPS